ncbi:MAG TPA: M20/M25/M40 family metallo-hydrolase, partial [Gemmatimonadota bacterium]|nr:M20/M25/M40 family metallo-hydrolase [Gemmatimonadota bacterium]
QRGSVMDGQGDPTTPGGPSRPGAPRVAPGRSWFGLPEIPVVPVSYRVATEILARVRGPEVPRHEWQGGLPLRYHVGPGPARVRVEVADDRSGPAGGIKTVHDVIARVRGAEIPDEWVVVGAHIDAWGAGANDNVSGTVSVLAAARAVAAEAAAGRPPRRTIVFAGWDAEEWGLIGSVEWVEEHAEALGERAVGYLNQDAIGGTRFGAAAAPSLKPLLREAAGAVPAGEGRTLRDVWRAASDAADLAPPVGDLGGGSDFAGFYNHLGIPSVGHGFGTPGGVYHSAYDTWPWMARFGDPGFANHARSSMLTAILALRLANAEIHPYDPAVLARELAGHWATLAEAAAGAGMSVSDAAAALDASLGELERAGRALEAARAAYVAGPVDAGRSARANAELRRAERALTREAGLVGRPWYRNLTFAADARNGYATIALPSIAEALRSGDPDRLRREVRDLAGRVAEAARRAAAATAGLTAP